MPRKTVIPYSSKPPVRIGIINHLYKTNKYIDIPKVFLLAEESVNWMNFASDGGYYPVAFLDEDGKVCKIKSGIMCAEITLCHSDTEKNTIRAPLMDSIGWFKKMTFHLLGKVHIKFYSPIYPEVPPLERFSDVCAKEGDEISRPIEESKTPVATKKQKKTSLRTPSTSADIKDEEDEDDSEGDDEDADEEENPTEHETATENHEIKDEEENDKEPPKKTETPRARRNLSRAVDTPKKVEDKEMSKKQSPVRQTPAKATSNPTSVRKTPKNSSSTTPTPKKQTSIVPPSNESEPTINKRKRGRPRSISPGDATAIVPVVVEASVTDVKKEELPISTTVTTTTPAPVATAATATTKTYVTIDTTALSLIDNTILHRPWIPSLYILTPMNTIYTLSPGLHGVLLNDRERWVGYSSTSIHDYRNKGEMKPPKRSVYDLLFCKELKPKRLNQVTKPRHYWKVNVLLNGFNQIFLDVLLYEREKKYLESYLQQIKISSDDSLSFSHHFGPIYLLRYLVYILTKNTSLTINGVNNNAVKDSLNNENEEGDEEVEVVDVGGEGEEEEKEEVEEEEEEQVQKKIRRDTPEWTREKRKRKGKMLYEEIYQLAERVLDLLNTDSFFPCLY